MEGVYSLQQATTAFCLLVFVAFSLQVSEMNASLWRFEKSDAFSLGGGGGCSASSCLISPCKYDVMCVNTEPLSACFAGEAGQE